MRIVVFEDMASLVGTNFEFYGRCTTDFEVDVDVANSLVHDSEGILSSPTRTI